MCVYYSSIHHTSIQRKSSTLKIIYVYYISDHILYNQIELRPKMHLKFALVLNRFLDIHITLNKQA